MGGTRQLRQDILNAYDVHDRDRHGKSLERLVAMTPAFTQGLTREQLEDQRQAHLVQLAAINDALRRMNEAAGRHQRVELEQWLRDNPPKPLLSSLDPSDP